MAARKICESCGKNFGKSSYYAHLPCAYGQQFKSGDGRDYVFCGHCNKRVAKKTYYEHQGMESSTCGIVTVPRPSNIIIDSSDCPATSDQDIPDNFIHVEYIPENEDDLGLDELNEEDQAFFSDNDGQNSANEDASMLYADVGDDDGNRDEGDEEFEYCEEDQEKNCSHGHHSSAISSESKALILFILLWQTMYKVSDRGIIVLLKFIQSFIMMIAKVMKMELLIEFAKSLPITIYRAKMYLGLVEDEFDKYAACPKCMTLYKTDECAIRKPNGKLVSKKCTHIDFPNHPQRGKREKKCGALLMKRMKSKSGSFFLYPKRMYCFRKLTDSLKSLLTVSGILESCESWRKRNQKVNSMSDSFDGRIWTDFLDHTGKPYFSTPGNLGVMLNVDWFQPYKHTQHSCGVIYLVLMNLPREERFKVHNVIIVGIIPGPKEPKGNINTFLKPLVDELIDLWDGVILEDKKFPGGMFKVRVALLALCCDIPATRKCGGFAGHSARKGCNKCFKTFPCPSFGSKSDFSGFNVEDWEKRTNNLHRLHAESVRTATCQTQKQGIIRETGARYSVLFQLPYYDTIRFVLIDPMHNLFLGIAKNTMKIWKSNDLISEKDFHVVQSRVNAVIPPPEIGRIPSKIATGFAGFTADQWKNWVCYYSMFALKDILPQKHYNCWLHFVQACRLICSRVITVEQCAQAEVHILKFCKEFQKLYGRYSCTPNLHLSCHLVECIRDYGPVYSFWCFSFERYNGILGSYHKNNNNIGIQLMRKFLRDSDLQRLDFPSEHDDFRSLLSEIQSGSVGETMQTHQPCVAVPCPPVKRVALDENDSRDLEILYENLYPGCTIRSLRICDSCSKLRLNGTMYRCSNNLGVIATLYDGEVRPGKIRRFLNHDAIIIDNSGKRKRISNFLAEVEWFKKHPEENAYGHPLQVWSTDKEYSFIDVDRFNTQCIIVNYKVRFCHGNETVNVIIPKIESV